MTLLASQAPNDYSPPFRSFGIFFRALATLLPPARAALKYAPCAGGTPNCAQMDVPRTKSDMPNDVVPAFHSQDW